MGPEGRKGERSLEGREGIKSTLNNRLQPSPNISLLYAYHGHDALDRNLALHIRNVSASRLSPSSPPTFALRPRSRSFDKLVTYSKKK